MNNLLWSSGFLPASLGGMLLISVVLPPARAEDSYLECITRNDNTVFDVCMRYLRSGRGALREKAKVYEKLSIAYSSLTRVDEKLRNYDKALDFSSKALEIFEALRQQRKIDSTDQADAATDVAHQRRGRARIFYYLRRFQEAINDMDRAIEIEPGSMRDRYYLERAEMLAPIDKRAAIDAFSEIIKRKPSVEALGDRGHLYFTDSKFEDATHDLTEAIRQTRSDSKGILAARGAAYFASNKFFEAAEDFYQSGVNSASRQRNREYFFSGNVAPTAYRPFQKDNYSYFPLMMWVLATLRSGHDGVSPLENVRQALEPLPPYSWDAKPRLQIVDLFLGRSTEKGVLAAAQDVLIARCDGLFFIAERYFLQSKIDEATTIMRSAVDSCVHSAPETLGIIAQAELTRWQSMAK